MLSEYIIAVLDPPPSPKDTIMQLHIISQATCAIFISVQLSEREREYISDNTAIKSRGEDRSCQKRYLFPSSLLSLSPSCQLIAFLYKSVTIQLVIISILEFYYFKKIHFLKCIISHINQ